MKKAILLQLILIIMSVGQQGTFAQSLASDPLLFPKDSFTTLTRNVRTSSGDRIVTYRAYMHIPYVSAPVDKDYQSLNVLVPVSIDNVDVDASASPILFAIGVGGYMSVNNARSNPPGGAGNPSGGGGMSSREDLALAAGFTVVSPGCRGRDNNSPDGTFYGKAPAAIVDLKAAVRYLRHNKGIIPGNTDRIVSVGCSAGGALSALLGTSGNSPLYDTFFNEIGAADEQDGIFASACFSPITDLEHADMAYEWNFGAVPTRSGLVDQELSAQLKAMYAEYQSSLDLSGKNGFGKLMADNYSEYLLKYFLIPSADKYLREISEEERKEYLDKNGWIAITDAGPSFTFEDYVNHVGRMKGLPAFDDFDLRQPEPNLFGNTRINARHFTDFSLKHSAGDKQAEVEAEVRELVDMMNAMYFLRIGNRGCASQWWLRNGTSDNHTSQTIMVNLATRLENLGKNVNTLVFWDGGHCADYDPEGFIEWIKNISVPGE
ncbi:MAG: subtype B tannase [Bacteroidales bacterium]